MHTSFPFSQFPDTWLITSVTIIFKKGDKLDPNHDRPISLVSYCDTLMETIIAKTLIDFLLDHNIVPKAQHGFFTWYIYNNQIYLNSWTLYLDFSKALHCVPAKWLAVKLDYFGTTDDLSHVDIHISLYQNVSSVP